MTHASAASAKTALRLALRQRRRELAAEAQSAAEQAAALAQPPVMTDGFVVAGYRASGGEIDPWPLMRRLAEAGARLALPVALDRASPLRFRAWTAGEPLTPDAFNIASPTDTAREIEPDLIIAPLLAFDRRGGRIGQGGGHYDRTLAALRARRPVFVLGLAYAGQEVAEIPLEPHDQRLDAILTEKAYIVPSKDF
jgi:5-formyltetrahydrofolate cyclo-ligase